MVIASPSKTPLPLFDHGAAGFDVPELKKTFSELGREVITSRIAQQNIITQSVQDGGPASIQGAMKELMSQGNIGVRAMSLAVGEKRKILLGMLEGRIPMPPEVVNKIITVLEKRLPHLFAGNKTSLTKM